LRMAGSYHKIGDTLDEMGDSAKALNSLRKAHKLMKIHGGDDYPDIGEVLNSLGCALDSLGKFSQSYKAYSASLDFCLRIFGEMHPKTSIAYYNLGWHYSAKKNLDLAFPYIQKSCQIDEKILGADHIEMGTDIYMLGNLYLETGRVREAEECYNRSLRIRREHLGDHHTDTAVVVRSLGRLDEERGDIEAALEKYLHCLRVEEDIYGGMHRETADSRKYVARALIALGRVSEAKLQMEQALKAELASFKSDRQPDVGETYHLLGIIEQKLGRLPQAASHFQKAWTIRKKALDPGSDEIKSSYEAWRECGGKPER